MVLTQLLDRLEAHHGAPRLAGPTDAYKMVIYLNCGYPPADDKCRAGFKALEREVGLEPDALLCAEEGDLVQAMRVGGIFPELRASRLKQIAQRVNAEYGGDTRRLLQGVPVEDRKRLKRFPTIGDPGVDKILLFAGDVAIAAVPSNCVHVPLRLGFGREGKSYATSYRSVQECIGAALPHEPMALKRAYLLLRRHGETLCKRTAPLCDHCPVRLYCPYGKSRPAAAI